MIANEVDKLPPALEHDIQNSIIELINTRGGVVTRVNSGAAIFKRDGATQVIKGAEKGTSDLIFCFLGLYCACEVKRPGAKPATSDQIEFLTKVARAGGIGIVAYEWEIIQNVLNVIETSNKITMSDNMFDMFHYSTSKNPNKLFME